MIRWLRELHVAVGLFCLPLALVYALSAWQMGHPGLPGPATRETRREVTLGGAVAPEAVRALLDAPGESAVATRRDAAGDTLAWRSERLATAREVRISARTGTGVMVEERGNLLAVLNRLHHTAGFAGHGWRDSWGVLVVLASVGMIVLGLGGIVLWFPRLADRRLGTLVLGLSTAVSIGLVVWIRTRG